jgi:hypothetical protein
MIGNAFMLNGLGSTVDMKGSQVQVLARQEDTRKTKQVGNSTKSLN